MSRMLFCLIDFIFLLNAASLVKSCPDHLIRINSDVNLKYEKYDLFELSIIGEPEFYVPGSTYIVGIESTSTSQFKEFYLTTKSYSELEIVGGTQIGWFHLMPDEDVQFSSACMNTVIEQSSKPKQSVHLFWRAPPPGFGCLYFKAEVLFKRELNTYVQTLNRTFCELKEQIISKFDESCCPCDEASYSMTFEGLWSNTTHPKDFPSALQLTHFSDIIAATHSPAITMWAEGQYATEGVRQLAEYGSPSVLESELLEKKTYLRSLFKVPGLWYPKINSNTTSKFRVDKNRNLLSLATMIGPSPDWFVGISKFNLCSKECTWIENQVVDLYPYDAGTDSGYSYMYPNSATVPQEKIYRITNKYPEDPRAPFHDPMGSEIQPLARLYLKREHITSKPCTNVTVASFDQNSNLQTTQQLTQMTECITTNFTEWGPCSASCGKGVRMKSRSYIDSKKAKRLNCNQQLFIKETCMAVAGSCPGENMEDTNLLQQDENCQTTNYTEWSECTATCGIGFMTRTRRFLKRSGIKKCKHVQILEKKKCMEPPCKVTKIEKEETNCSTTEWTDWSPCSASCGKGIRLRSRHLLVSKDQYERCLKSVLLEEHRECDKTAECAINANKAQEICGEEKEIGPCRGRFHRWYYDIETLRCSSFIYGGCRGNRNNFLTLEECTKICPK